MWRRRSWFSLNGKAGIPGQTEGRPATPIALRAPPAGSLQQRDPRDTAANIQRRKMIRRGATYGSLLPDGAPEDGVDRGVAAFVICASLVRQFEFAQNVWINGHNFHELGNERDPVCGNHDGSLELKKP